MSEQLSAWPTTDEVRATFGASDRLAFNRWLAAHDREVKAEVRESLAADLDRMAAESHQNAEYRAGLGHAADLVRPVSRIESEARP